MAKRSSSKQVALIPDPWNEPGMKQAARAAARADGVSELELDDVEERFDDYINRFTGVGDYLQDKMFGGRQNGPEFFIRFLSMYEAESRWRGSDLGGRIVETIPDEMTREGFDVVIQPTDDKPEDEEDTDPSGAPDGMEDPAWLEQPDGDKPVPEGADGPPSRVDAFPPGGGGGPPGAAGAGALHPAVAAALQPTEKVPGELPEQDDEGPAIEEEVEGICEDLGVLEAFWQAMAYERAFGGGAILIGAEDGMKKLTKPLDEENITSVDWLNVFQGGREGEIVAWSYYTDLRSPKYGQPEIYMIRNLGTPISKVPTPDEPPGSFKGGGMQTQIFWVHESRLLVFGGVSTSRLARTQNRGWGDSVFTRVDEVLSQYGQTWGGLANLMSSFNQDVLKMGGMAVKMAGGDKTSLGKAITKRARLVQQTRSMIRMMVIDADEEMQRLGASVSGVAEFLQQFALRVAAAADMPLSLLFGQTQGGLGDAGNTDIRFFYDKVAAKQRKKLGPLLKRLIKLIFLSKEGPTKGEEPERWDIQFRSLYQMTDTEKATLRKTVADMDKTYIDAGVITPEEVAASRFGGSDWSMETTIDFEGRKKMAAQAEKDKADKLKAMQQGGMVPPGGAPPGAPGSDTPPDAAPPDAPPEDDKEQKKNAADFDELLRGDAGEFNEELHPRASDGRFGETAGEHGGKKEKGESKGPGSASSGGSSHGKPSKPDEEKTPREKGLERFSQSRAEYVRNREGRLREVAEKHGIQPTEVEKHAKASKEFSEREKEHEGVQRAYERELARSVKEAEKATASSGPRTSDKLGGAPIPIVREWVDKVDGLPDPNKGGTMGVHFIGSEFNEKGEPTKIGTPTPERQKLHDTIKSKYLDHVPPATGTPIAILTMGAPASGKSSMLKKAGVHAKDYVAVDPDGIKDEIPEYKVGIDHNGARGTTARDSARLAHEESSYLAKQVRAEAIASRKNFIFDGTGANVNNYASMIKDLKEKGYQVRLMMTDLSVDEGMARASVRAEGSGRYVPDNFVRSAYSTIPKNFEPLSKLVDDAAMFDNHGSTRVVYQKSGNAEVVHDQAYWEKFKAGEPRGGKK